MQLRVKSNTTLIWKPTTVIEGMILSIDNNDTIAAICTGIGGSISIIRLSGTNALTVFSRIWNSKSEFAKIKPRQLVHGDIVDKNGVIKDQCLAIVMNAPNSYTGEDVVELHCHGGSLVSKTVLMLILSHGCRHAEPGEFTKRAFINGKMDLTQAEAVLDIIEAQSEMALHAANRQLDGNLRLKVNTLYDHTELLLAEIETTMDFTDEDLDWTPTAVIEKKLQVMIDLIVELLQSRETGEILRNGIKLAIIGIPNAGKSSLLNAILGRDRAIVTSIPGTTRDTLEEFSQIRGIPINLIDTAGLRDTNDLIEKAGIARSIDSMSQAQIILWVIDAEKPLDEQLLCEKLIEGKPVIAIANKIDLKENFKFTINPHFPFVKISATKGIGLEDLYDKIETVVWRYPHRDEPEIAINARHGILLEDAQSKLTKSIVTIKNQEFELTAVNLRAVLTSLGSITGKTVEPDILGIIFNKFCIGK